KTTGLRADADIIESGAFSLGLAVTVNTFDGSSSNTTEGSVTANLNGRDIRAVTYIADTFRQGSVTLRAGASVGAIITHGSLSSCGGEVRPSEDDTDSVIGEASVLAGLALGRDWRLTAGAIASLFQQQWMIGLAGALPSSTFGSLIRTGDVAAIVGLG